jgi:hypothetical protein
MSPQPDIVERLRARHSAWLANCRLPPNAKDESNFSMAAAEIERLRTALRAVRGSTDPNWQKQIIDEALRENKP